MKISEQLFAELRVAIARAGGLSPHATMRERWDALHASRYPIARLYDAGLNDDHIDTALRRIARGERP